MLRLLSGCGAAFLAVGTWRGSFGTIFFRASLVDDKRPSTQPFALQPINGGSAFCDTAHRHKREASRAASHWIIDDVFRRSFRRARRGREDPLRKSRMRG